MEMSTLIIIITALLIGYIYLRTKYKYWERRNISFMKPWPIFGNLASVITFRKSTAEVYKEAYDNFPNDAVVGIYELFTPVLVVRDPKLTEKILIKDFQYFVNRMKTSDPKSLFTTGLFKLADNRWRFIRSKISPTFSSGKLKLMFKAMLEHTDQLIETINKNLYKDYDIKDDLGGHTIDVIGSTVFGIEIKDHLARRKFIKMGRSVFEVGPLRFLKFFIIVYLPKMARFFGLSFMSEDSINYFKKLIKTTFEERQRNNAIQRSDFIQLLLKLKEQGSVEIQANEEEDGYLKLNDRAPTEHFEITDDLLAGQAFQFLSAGFDPLRVTILFTMLELSRHLNIQQRARKEIKEILEKHGGYSYEAVKEMAYLEQCIQETLRLYPLVNFLLREVTKTYVTDGGLKIEKGQKVIIPLSALHMDPKYYPEPEVFDPERLPPNSSRSNFIYLPFGDGPRMCIGLRFSLVEMKVVMAKIIENFKFTLSPRTKYPVDIHKQTAILMPKSEILFNITPV